MKALKSGVLVALVLVSAVVVVASPAFATPRLTASTGTGTRPDNSAVFPFITPIGNTTGSGVTATSPRSDFSATAALGVRVTVTCSSVATGYVGVTHTQARITDIQFVTCRPSIGSSATVSTTGNSTTPYLLHVTSYNGTTGSATGTFNIPTASPISISVRDAGGAVICGLTVKGVSVRGTYTNTARTLVVSDTGLVFSLDAGSSGICPNPANGTATQTGTYTLTPNTANDRVRVTSFSSQ